MTDSAPIHSAGWSARRWLFLVTVVFGLHVGLLWLVGSTVSSPRQNAAPALAWRLASPAFSKLEFPSSVWAMDPTLFAIASPIGFSGPAWLNQGGRLQEPAGAKEPPRWLAADPGRFGDAFERLIPASLVVTHVSEERAVVPGLWEMAVPTIQVVTQSVVRIDEALASRLVGLLPSLPAVASSDILEKTTIEIGVNGAGVVESARLLNAKRSEKADVLALETANRLRFLPVNSGPGAQGLTWGRLTFSWATIPLPPVVTNTSPTVIPPVIQ